MNLLTLALRSLAYYRGANFAIALGVMAGAAALVGALLVGASLRASLLRVALERLGPIDSAMIAQRFFREQLATDIASGEGFSQHYESATPLIIVRGSATQPERGARANRVNVFGVDERFWRLTGSQPTALEQRRAVALNHTLAGELGVAVGDDVLLSLGAAAPISSETLMGRRDQTTRSLRVTVRAILPSTGLFAFSAQAQQQTPANAYLSLDAAQELLEQPGRVNAIFVTSARHDSSANAAGSPWLDEQLRERAQLSDLGLRLRVDGGHGYAALESDSLLLDPHVESAALDAAQASGGAPTAVMSYLANDVALLDNGAASRNVPYSTIAALDPQTPAFARLLGEKAASLTFTPDHILLNDWAATDLGAAAGDRIRIEYYALDASRQLETRHATFEVAGVVLLNDAAADPGWTPEFKGVTDAAELADWDPPFPVDLKRVRAQDEAYWEKHRATPKAFLHLDAARRLFAEQEERFGRLNSIRIYPSQGAALAATAAAFESKLLNKLAPRSLGLTFEPLRARAAFAAQGNVDFGGLFIGFSFFLIAAAALLVSLLFRLYAERRAREIGLLLAIGFTPTRMQHLFLLEGATLATVGALLGVAVASGYAWLMLAGLRTWWSQAVRAPFLSLTVSPETLAVGGTASALIALGSLMLSLRGLTSLPTRSLLASVSTPNDLVRRASAAPRLPLAAIIMTLLALALAIAAATEVIPPVGAFFGSGAAALVAGILAFRRTLAAESQKPLVGGGAIQQARLGWLNARRNPGRSTLIVSLIAGATFVVVSLGAFRLDGAVDPQRRDTGLGGFTLSAEAAAALPLDLASEAGMAELGLSANLRDLLRGATIVPFRLRSGDDASCRNLYASTRPRIVGAGPSMIERGGFRFAALRAGAGANAWLLLNEQLPDGAIPAIGDEAAVRWQMKLGLGRELIVSDERGNPARLQFVALLSGSALQDEIIISEENFTRLFPSVQGHAFFLIDTGPRPLVTVEDALERELARFGFDVTPLARRLQDYLAVQNTYISTFQSLGGLGLVLGALGLTAVMLRNVWERRSELALLQAIGFTDAALRRVVLSENLTLAGLGILCGVGPALIAVAPLTLQRPAEGPWLTLLLVAGGVGATTWIVGRVALRNVIGEELRKAMAPE